MNTKFRLALLVAVALVAVLGFSVVNTQVQAQDYSGHTVVLGYAQYITDPASGEAGGITYFRSDLGNGQLAHDFVYNDPRAAWDTVPGISYGVKTGFQSSDVNLTNQLSWFGESFRVWERLQCSGLTLTENSVNPSSPGLVANFFSTGVLDIGLVQADVSMAVVAPFSGPLI